MARSRKTTFRKKVQKSRKQRGGGIQYDNFLHLFSFKTPILHEIL